MDITGHIDDPAFCQVCRRVVRKLIERYDWALLQEDDLVKLLLDSAQTETSLTGLEREAVHCYTAVLYEACRQSEDTDRRERAYYELFCYLFRAAYNRWPELAEDATQRALVLVYEQIDRCRSSGTFLAFALGKLRHAFQQEQEARDSDSLREKLLRNLTGRKGTAVHSRLDRTECLQVLMEAIRRLPDERQQKAIILRFFGDLSDKQIGAHLGITVSNVRVLRHPGITQLREDNRLQSYFEVTNNEKVSEKG